MQLSEDEVVAQLIDGARGTGRFASGPPLIGSSVVAVKSLPTGSDVEDA